MLCLNCKIETSNPKFCSSSCSASYNNRGVKRHGKSFKEKQTQICKVCGELTHNRLLCSIECRGIYLKKDISDLERRAYNAEKQSKYRMKKYRTFAPNADRKKMQLIYEGCPEGHEVDHIIPLSKGGLHHEDNLQYLTRLENRKKGAK